MRLPRQGGMVDDQKVASGTDIFIVDNSESDWKVVNHLRGWVQFSQSVDIATGYFEIRSLISVDGEWQKVDHIRILMGDEVTVRTSRALITARERVQRWRHSAQNALSTRAVRAELAQRLGWSVS